jgi:hypothetical protein
MTGWLMNMKLEGMLKEVDVGKGTIPALARRNKQKAQSG